MSRLYFNSPSGVAELRGAEFHHLRAVAHSLAEPFWRIKDLDDITDLLALVVRDASSPDYLFDHLAKAQAEHAENQRLWAARERGGPFPATCYDTQQQLRTSVKLALSSTNSPDLLIAGVRVGTAEIRLNTALRLGNDVIKLVVKIAGWGESHAWFDGKDRAWAADLIDQGLKTGILRDGMWYVDGPCEGLPKNHPDRQWSDMGWGAVTGFLRERDDEPVALSYSVADDFPGPGAGFDAALARLKERSPWLRLGPDTLDYWTFGPGVTVFDLYAADRDERVRRANADDGEEA